MLKYCLPSTCIYVVILLCLIGTMGPNKLQRLEDVLGRQGRQEHRGHRADWVDRADMVNSFKT